jgi:hypothetical protein
VEGSGKEGATEVSRREDEQQTGGSNEREQQQQQHQQAEAHAPAPAPAPAACLPGTALAKSSASAGGGAGAAKAHVKASVKASDNLMIPTSVKRRLGKAACSGLGAQFTCFTGTNVQILARWYKSTNTESC